MYMFVPCSRTNLFFVCVKDIAAEQVAHLLSLIRLFLFAAIIKNPVLVKTLDSLLYFTCHYANMPMQYTAIFHGCKNNIFQKKKCDFFLIFAQKIDCGYTLEPPQ